MTRLQVKEVRKRFNFLLLAGTKQSLEREIHVPELNRPGFELCGFYTQTDLRRMIILGDKEISFIRTLDDETLEERFRFLMGETTPAIVIARGYDCPEVVRRLANELNFPVLGTPLPTGRIFIDLIGYLDAKKAPSTIMHGVFLSIYGRGILIKGESGIGKSEVALELIKKGHLFVVDDNVELLRVRQQLIGVSPPLIKNMLEIRGIGIIDVVSMFGVSSVLEQDNVDFIIQLEHWKNDRTYARVGIEEDRMYEVILGVKVPKLIIPVSSGRNIAEIIEAAVMNLRLKETGVDSAKAFAQRIYDSLKQRGDE